MFTRLRLKNFKSFKHLDVKFGPLNLLIGTNASGKSNLREAFRFLHGIGRGYSLIEILGEKWGQGGDLLWTGIRGGPAEVTFWGEDVFEVEVEIPFSSRQYGRYLIAVERNQNPEKSRNKNQALDVILPRVVRESLILGKRTLFEVIETVDLDHVKASVWQGKRGRNPSHSFLSSRPVLSQIVSKSEVPADVRKRAEQAYEELANFRFLEPQPEAIRRPCFPGSQLGDHGENLAAALYDLPSPYIRDVFLEFLRALTPMDFESLVYQSDQTGRMQLWLEENGKKLSLASVSDGTLRFMALLTLLVAEKTKIFLEEIETGLHPSRLALLLEILQQSAESHGNQIFATSHSPQLLALLGDKAAECAYLALRSDENGCSTLLSLSDLPDDAVGILKNQNVGELHTSGWFEDIGYFAGVGC